MRHRYTISYQTSQITVCSFTEQEFSRNQIQHFLKGLFVFLSSQKEDLKFYRNFGMK